MCPGYNKLTERKFAFRVKTKEYSYLRICHSLERGMRKACLLY